MNLAKRPAELIGHIRARDIESAIGAQHAARLGDAATINEHSIRTRRHEAYLLLSSSHADEPFVAAAGKALSLDDMYRALVLEVGPCGSAAAPGARRAPRIGRRAQTQHQCAERRE